MKNERPWLEGAKGAVGDPQQDHPNAPPSPVESPKLAADPVPIRDKLVWGWDDIAALTGLSRRLLQREVSARRMPAPDVTICRRALWRPETIRRWIEGGGKP
ncbi:MAG: helix-turn-helix transcriptional regulator [Isosphaeraceae bacterium]